jgi:thiol-disulfide isomerase/thioredoxin
MTLKQIITIAILLSFFNYSSLMAQNKENTNIEKKEYLKGLSIASEDELNGKQVSLDGETFPVYNEKGERIRGMEMMTALTSGNYFPDFYMDVNKEIKAVVLRAATEDEKKKITQTSSDINSQNELVDTNAPFFSVTDINGNEYSLDSLKGKIIVMNFWFVECKPCVIEIPELNNLVEKYKNKDVVFLGFATNEKSRIDSFLKKKDFSYNIITNSIEIAQTYKVSGYPTHTIIDKNSKIVYSTSGLGPTTINDIEKTIDNLIKK